MLERTFGRRGGQGTGVSILVVMVMVVMLSACHLPFAPKREKARLSVTDITRVADVDPPAFTMSLTNTGRVAVDEVRISLSVLRQSTIIDTGLGVIRDVRPGQSAVVTPLIHLYSLDSHADYDCYQYRIDAVTEEGEQSSLKSDVMCSPVSVAD